MQAYSAVKTTTRTREPFQRSTDSIAEFDGEVVERQESLRIFLVEDSPVIRDLIVDDLSGIPGVVLVGTAETEKDAMEELSGGVQCDVMIVDIQLRQGNGINLLRALSERTLHKDCLKLVLSNHVSGTYRRLCEQYGVRYFFDKSSEFSQLHALIAHLRNSAGAH